MPIEVRVDGWSKDELCCMCWSASPSLCGPWTAIAGVGRDGSGRASPSAMSSQPEDLLQARL